MTTAQEAAFRLRCLFAEQGKVRTHERRVIEPVPGSKRPPRVRFRGRLYASVSDCARRLRRSRAFVRHRIETGEARYER